MQSISTVERISKCLNTPPDFERKFIALDDEDEPIDVRIFDVIWKQESMLKTYFFAFQPHIEKCF